MKNSLSFAKKIKQLLLIFYPFLLSIFLLSGCAGMEERLQDDRTVPPADSLWKVQIRQWGAERFTGLLAMSSEDKEMRVALLDPTGIKLLEAEFDRAGSVRSMRALAAVENKGLPDFLTSSLQKIFYGSGEISSCSGGVFLRLCHEQTGDKETRKRSLFGPIPIWSVDYRFFGTGYEEIQSAELHVPWYGISFIMSVIQSEIGTRGVE